MRIERVDERTVKCYLSNEELEQYDIDYKDFVTRSDKAREVMQEIIGQAVEEVGYRPPKFAFDLQIMMIPEQGMVLTFTERDPEDIKDGLQMLEILREMRRLLHKKNGQQEPVAGSREELEEQKQDADLAQQIAQAAREQLERALQGQPTGEAQTSQTSPEPQAGKNAGKSPSKNAGQTPEFALFAFRNASRVMEYAAVLPKTLRVKSALYLMDGLYYIHMEKGGASYERYSKACVQALEFAGLAGADEEKVAYLKEHGECLIAEQALKKLR